MQIENHNVSGCPIGHVRQTVPAEAVKRSYKAAKAAPQGDYVTLSARSRELAIAQRHLSEVPDVREELVQRLRAEVAAGTYRPSSQQVAARMLAELRHVLQG